jgi:thiol-disulfide isomerase/thioredoxin
MIIFLIVVFVVVGYYSYIQVSRAATNKSNTNDISNLAPTNKEIVVTMYHVDWCPHCKKAMPEWQQFVSEYNNKLVNGYKIKCVDLDCTDNKNVKIKNLLEKDPVIDSVPTVRGVMPGNGGKEITIQFKSRISKNKLEKFVLSISSPK